MSDHSKILTQRQFGTHAAGYVASPVHAGGYSLTQLVEMLDPQPGWRVLDLATGGGHTALAVAPRVAWTVAGDLTHAMLVAARDHLAANSAGGVAFVRLDAEDLPFGTACFDAVTCRIAAHHFPQVARFVDEAARVVKPGGLVVVNDQLSPCDPKAARFVNVFERLRDPSHVWAYNEAEWKGFFAGAGLDVTGYEAFDTHHDLTAWAERMGCDAPAITRLRAMLVHAPPPVAAWMKPVVPPAGEASFVIRQFLLMGRKR
jgi:SAM-dependent methyltransferase